MSTTTEAVDHTRQAQAALKNLCALEDLITKSRGWWLEYGRALWAQRRQTPSNEKFGEWVQTNKLDIGPASGAVARSNAMWFAREAQDAGFLDLTSKMPDNEPGHLRQACRDTGYTDKFDAQTGERLPASPPPPPRPPPPPAPPPFAYTSSRPAPPPYVPPPRPPEDELERIAKAYKASWMHAAARGEKPRWGKVSKREMRLLKSFFHTDKYPGASAEQIRMLTECSALINQLERQELVDEKFMEGT